MKPTSDEQVMLLAYEALRLMDERHLEPQRACDQAVFGQGENHNYTEEGGELFYPVMRKLRKLIRQVRMKPRQAIFTFSHSATTRRG